MNKPTLREQNKYRGSRQFYQQLWSRNVLNKQSKLNPCGISMQCVWPTQQLKQTLVGSVVNNTSTAQHLFCNKNIIIAIFNMWELFFLPVKILAVDINCTDWKGYWFYIFNVIGIFCSLRSEINFIHCLLEDGIAVLRVIYSLMLWLV